MKIHDVAQGSGDWLRLRLGIPTASQFHKIVTPTGKLSKQARGYAFFLITEKLLNYSLDSISNLEWIARGQELEPQAVKMYEFEQELRTIPVGFITTDDMRMGASPDRLIEGAPGALELKCPAPQTHVEYMLDGFGNDYVPQVQGQMLVGEFEWVDRYSYHPEMPPVLIRTYRDEAYLAGLRSALNEFCDMKDELLERAQKRGLFVERRRLITATDKIEDRDDDPFGLPPLTEPIRRGLSGESLLPEGGRPGGEKPPAPPEPASPDDGGAAARTDDMNDRVLRGLAAEEGAQPNSQRSDMAAAGVAERRSDANPGGRHVTEPREPSDRAGEALSPGSSDPPPPASPAASPIAIVKPHGGEPDWPATRKRLVEAFYDLMTIPDCDAFRLRHSATINALRDFAPDEFEIWDTLAATHERVRRVLHGEG